MLHKTRAIIMSTLRYGESSLIVHAYTEQWGRLTLMLKGVRKPGKRGRVGMFQPLHMLELDVYYRENREMQWIRDVAFSGDVPGMQHDVVKSTQALFLGEVLVKTIGEEERNPELFGFLAESVRYFGSLQEASPSFHLVFLFRLTRHLGFYPRNNFSERNRYFNLSAGDFGSVPETTDLEGEALLGRQWHSCFTNEYNTADQAFTNHDQRNRMLDALLRFYRLHHAARGELRSLEVLRTVFS